MSSSATRFAPPSDQEVTRLVREYPFAWLISMNPADFAATPLPLIPRVDEQGSVVALLGHFARSNPHVQLLRATPRTLILFMGPHGYISSSWLADRTRTPTWNYAMVQYLVDIEFMDDPVATDALISEQVATMELGQPNAWSVPEMGSRYERLVSGIVGFRAHIRERRVKFKLGQDERDAEYADITTALASGSNDDATLLEWMHRSNRTRKG
jgi:predicted FMN-binding regulatory protein PaiB